MSRQVFQTDNLVVRNILISPIQSGNYPVVNSVLFSDGTGQTFWATLSTTITTTFNAIQGDTLLNNASNARSVFTLQSGTGIGQINTTNNTLKIFSKSFQTFSITGINGPSTISAYTNNYVTPVVFFSTFGGLDIIPDSATNTLVFSLSTINSIQDLNMKYAINSTIKGLGTYGYLSSILLDPNFVRVSTSVSLSASTVSTILRPSIERNVTSTTIGLGSLGYVSSFTELRIVSSAVSYGLSTVYYAITSNVIPSTIKGLGTFGYFSDIRGYSNTSTSIGPGLSTVFSSLSTTQGIFSYRIFPSTITGLGSIGYTSTLSDFSSIKTSTIRFEDYKSREQHQLFTSSSRLYFNSTIISGTPVLTLQRFIL